MAESVCTNRCVIGVGWPRTSTAHGKSDDTIVRDDRDAVDQYFVVIVAIVVTVPATVRRSAL